MNKTDLHNECLRHQKEIIENIEYAMSEAQRSANEYGQPKDRYDSYRAQLLRKRDLFAKQLHQALEKLDILQKIDPDAKIESVRFGAAVKTDLQNLYVCIGLGKIVLNDEIWYAISPQVPIYDAIKGLKRGDSYEFRGNKSRIIEVF